MGRAELNKNAQKLSSKQLMAIDMILMGSNDREVAESIGVGRNTVNKWKNHDEDFQAELNERRRELNEATQNRIRSLTQKALDAIEYALERGDARIALEVLKMAGFAKLEEPPIDKEHRIIVTYVGAGEEVKKARGSSNE
jgi:Skp family chaperone for outer membrane proteins